MIAQEKMKEAALVGVLEMLFQPEYSGDFVREMLGDEGAEDVSEDDVDAVSSLIDRELGMLAGSIVGRLREEGNIDLYFDKWFKFCKSVTEAKQAEEEGAEQD